MAETAPSANHNTSVWTPALGKAGASKLDGPLNQLLNSTADPEQQFSLTICCKSEYLPQARAAIKKAGSIQHESKWLNKGTEFLAVVPAKGIPNLARSEGIERVYLARRLKGIR